jgi:hypothetical protein
MPSETIVSFTCPSYLIKFFEYNFGTKPILFPTKHRINRMLERHIEIPLSDYIPPTGENVMEIRLPFFVTKDVRSYNYISPLSQKILIHVLKSIFIEVFYSEIDSALIDKYPKKFAINFFIEKYRLPIDCYDQLKKDYQRYLNSINMKKRSKFMKDLNITGTWTNKLK